MKIQHKPGNITRNAIVSVKQTIAQDKIASAVLMLRDKIYTDKRKAAIQETICNAVDEHRKHNVKRPVDVLITKEELCIRDYAKGLNQDGVLHTFFQFFASTKDHNNDAIGGFGIGAKAPGAYADIWTVESWHEGKHSVYTSVTEGQEATASLVFEEECSEEDTGIMVRIPIADEKNECHFVATCVTSLASMIGYHDEDEMVSVYGASDHNTLDELIADCKCDTMAEALQITSHVSKLRVTHIKEYINTTKNGLKGKLCFIAYSTLKEYIDYPFWNDRSLLIYDGDVMYKASTGLDDIIQNKFDTYIPSKYDMGAIVMCERGQLSVSPSRETIETDTVATEWVRKCVLDTFAHMEAEVNADIISDVIDASERAYNDQRLASFCRKHVYNELLARTLRSFNFKATIAYQLKEVNSKSVFRLTRIRQYGFGLSLMELKEGCCIVDAVGLDPDIAFRQLRNWIAENGGLLCGFDTFFFVYYPDVMASNIKSCAINGNCFLRENEHVFPASHFGITGTEDGKQTKRARRKRKETPVDICCDVSRCKIPEERYKTTLFFLQNESNDFVLYRDEGFYKFLGYTDIVMVPSARKNKLERLGFVCGKDLPCARTKSAARAELAKVLSYIKKSKLLVSGHDSIFKFKNLCYGKLTPSFGRGVLNGFTTRFLEHVSYSAANAIREVSKDLFSPEEYIVMLIILNSRHIENYVLDAYKADRYADILRNEKYSKKMNTVFRKIKLNDILKKQYAETLVALENSRLPES